MILLEFTCSACISGTACNRTGGSVSLGPPVGGTILAQPVIKGTRVRAQADQEKKDESLHVLSLQTYWRETEFIQIYDFINFDVPLLLQQSTH